ncbi:MAG: mannose-1-phosphate guanylyltransferase [Deltaproteobacteria bacterium]|nr:mannose-1-phosphate guanylyltransferase [Deltaproteobacteria bacterium]
MPKNLEVNKKSSAHGVILAGGAGTRLWPLSTPDCPKQFLKLFSEFSLIEETLKRLQLCQLDSLWIVAAQSHKTLFKKYLPAFDLGQILLEPQAKNTAAALVWAAMEVSRQDPEALMAVFPADHYIPDQDQKHFIKNLEKAFQLAKEKNALVTFGIPPDHASTAYGYLEVGQVQEGYAHLKSFHEKPEAKRARQYLETGHYYWNSGMFVWKAKVFLEEFAKHHSESYDLFKKFSEGTLSLEELYETLPSISVDYAVMEKASLVLMVPADFGWSDVGGFKALDEILPKDQEGNAKKGKGFFLDAKHNLAINQGNKPLVLFGVEDLVVVDSEEATLVMPKDKLKEIKSLQEALKKIKD